MGWLASAEQLVPEKQRVQLVFPSAPTTLVESQVRFSPEHTEQDWASQSLAKLFPLHIVQVRDPDTDWAVPGGHKWQNVLPSEGWNRPDSHLEQRAMPATLAKVPFSQTVQRLCAALGASVPGAHWMHSESELASLFM